MSKLPAALLIAASLTLVGCQQDDNQVTAKIEPIRPAKIVKVVASDSLSVRRFPAIIEAANQTQISFRTSGQVEALEVQAGQQVTKGQLLAKLDDTDYQNNIMQAQANHDLAKVQHEQISQLYEQKYASKTELEQVTAQLKAAKAALQMAQEALDHTRLLAPMEGIVDRVNIKNHQLVSPQLPVLQLRTLDDFDIRFDIPESLLSQIQKVADPHSICLNVHFNGHPQKSYPACYKENESSPDPMSRSYSMVFAMAPITDFTLMPGMSSEVEIDLSQVMVDKPSSGVLVPTEALFEQQGSTYVWLVDQEMYVHKTAVSTGQMMNEGILVLEGLKHGDQVVAAGVAYIQDKMQVRALQKERGL